MHETRDDSTRSSGETRRLTGAAQRPIRHLETPNKATLPRIMFYIVLEQVWPANRVSGAYREAQQQIFRRWRGASEGTTRSDLRGRGSAAPLREKNQQKRLDLA